MEPNAYGRIVNVASIAGKEGNPHGRRLLGLEGGGDRDDEGARQGRRRPILVNCIAPAVIQTPMLGD